MSKDDDLIDAHVSLKQCRQAVEALHSHELKKKEKFEETQLLPGKDQHVWLNVTVKQIPAHHKLKPLKIPIVHPLVDPRTSSVCLLTKDPQRQYKDLLETHNIKFISRVVGIEKLRGKFKAFEARRMLLKENDLFLADDRIIPLLPKLLGSKWFEAKKQPIPVCLTRKDLKGELERAISSTYMNQNRGTCTSIKIGKLSQTPSHILENLQTALPAVAKAVKGDWDNIQNFTIKTNSSVSLPIWSCTLTMPESRKSEQRDAEEEDQDVDKEDEEEKEEEEVKVAKEQASRKGKKRVTNSDEEIEGAEKPRKRSKAADGLTVRGVSKKLISKKVEKKEEVKAVKERKRVTNFDEEEIEGIEMLRKKSKAADGVVRGLSISEKEMRQKRSAHSASTSEKKKRIVLSSKGSKSMKYAVLGKKVGTSQIHP